MRMNASTHESNSSNCLTSWRCEKRLKVSDCMSAWPIMKSRDIAPLPSVLNSQNL